MKETKVICPKCGAEIAIAEHEHVSTGVVIGKDSNLGTVELPPADREARPSGHKSNKAEDRLAALRAAGVDTSNLFAMQGASGNGMIARLSNGILTQVTDDDPIFSRIKEKGTIPDRRLFRRWIMSQVFHGLTTKDWMTKKPIGFNDAIRRRGYEYQWKMIMEEFRVQSKLYKNDLENYLERNRWFNRDVVVSLCTSYIDELNAYFNKLALRHCKGIPYKRFLGKDIFVDDFNSKVVYPLRRHLWTIKGSKNPNELYTAMVAFNRDRPALPYNTPFCKDWFNAYKGAGAFYTLKNLVLFHNCVIIDRWGVKLDRSHSMEYLLSCAEEYKKEGWRLFALMKKTIADNNIDINAKFKEWSESKRNK